MSFSAMACCKCGLKKQPYEPESEIHDELNCKTKKNCKPEEEFAGSTSCHGIGYWWSSRFAIQRMFWVVLVVGMFCGMIQQVATRVSNYYEYKTTTEVSRDFKESLEFPAVTFCNFNRLFSPESDQELAAMHALNRVTDTSWAEYAASMNISLWDDSLDFFSNMPGFKTSEYYTRKGFRLVDRKTLFYCRFAQRACKASEFTPILTDYGKCFTFNADPKVNLSQQAGGSFNGLSFYLDVMNWNYTEEPFVGSDEAGLRFQVHSKADKPNVANRGMAIPVGTKAYVAMRRKDIHNMYKPWGVCDPKGEKDLLYFKNYTMENCMLECVTSLVIAACECRQYYEVWVEDVVECTIAQMANCSTPLLAKLNRDLTPSLCGCNVPCLYHDYSVTVTYASQPNYPNQQFFKQVATRVSNYYEYKTTTEVSRDFKESLEFPAVTFCNFNRLFSPESDQELAAMHALNRVTDTSWAEYAASMNISLWDDSLDFFSNMPGFKTSEYYTRKGFRLVDRKTLFYCRFAQRACKASEFTPILTDYGKCFTFNADPKVNLSQQAGGSFNGLSFYLDVMNWNYTEEPFVGSDEAGLRFQVHSKADKPNVANRGMAIPVGTKAYVAMRRKDIHNMYKPWGVCDPKGEKDLLYFKNYTMENCMLECVTSLVIAACECRQYYEVWVEDVVECTIAQMANCSTPLLAKLNRDLTPSLCGCNVPCLYHDYSVTVTYASQPNYPNQQFFKGVVKPGYFSENLVAVDVAFEQMNVMKETQSKKVDESALLSDIGGQLGLWVGMSLITVVEVMQYLFFRCRTFVKAPAADGDKQTTKTEETEIEENGV